ncbi:MAG TPA: long-chain fatty acid--CoA ligase [Streptosporangiaceae bacterium]|nr:long-chain fatty acid--CoA ligase [Streptosporangiaceae bacterium]
MLNLAVVLEDSARQVPERVAVVHGGARMTYAELDAAASQVAGALAARGIGRADRVALSCPNLPYFPVVYFGILKAGATVVPLNTLLTEREIAYHLADSAARAYFCFEGTPELPMGKVGFAASQAAPECEHFVLLTADPGAAPPSPEVETLAEFTHRQPVTFTTAPTAETDTAVILYTSGTTGQPKGAELTHSNMVQNALMANRLFGLEAHDVHLLALPLFHSFGQSVQMNQGFSNGATLVLMSRFDANQALALMEREKVTFFAGVPTMYHALLNCAGTERIAGQVRVAVSGGAALPVEVLRQFEERFRVPILEGYGLSETSPVATFNRVGRPRKPGTVGLPAWGIEVKTVSYDGSAAAVDEPGEVAIRGHNVMKGYFQRPEATAAAIDSEGWFHTGDIGVIDADGYLAIVDRKKDMIIRGGFNVYPRELEEVLLTHSEVSLAAVVGVPHPSHGEEVKAFVVRTPGATITETELITWCKGYMAAYKYPRIVEFRDSFPMTATGKILKRELIAQSMEPGQ